ncbi:hypothetical protein SLEP1_g23779 [Rubroshorea leprosula]|uniref:Uncharacterized protein n=1 Tax=Rubroshorea leprosula TaxID=152421 RepID=A0AAV5JNV4_9ROSI|nr:hypothetical protein SLEP1_g23779 [Rubroshorea leprosula]
MDASSLAAGYYIGKNVLQELLAKLGCLRVLSLSGYCIDDIPYSIGHLKHLRYLNLSHSTIKQLPESVGNLFNLQTLLLRGCKELTKLPQGKLIKLQVLSKFCVGKDNRFGIRELKDLKHLKGELSITGLENVVNVWDARDANLMDKHGIDGLYLKWSSEFLDHQNEEGEMLVLDMPKPNKDLKELTISFYGSERFPSWLGDPSFTNIVHMNLITANMLEWEHWSSTHKGDEDLDDEFPSLRGLMLQNCPRLTGDLPRHLPSLVKLIISRCPKLEGSLVSLPSLCELNIEDCSKEQLKNIVHLTSLTTLRIQSIRDLACLPQEMLESLGALQTLDVSNCAKPTFLWQKGTGLRNIVSLKHLKIKGCSKFVSLIENEQGLSGSLDDIELINYGDYGKLTLKSLHIESCPKLVSFPETGCLSTLRHLKLKDCVTLKNLPDWKMMLNYKTSDCLLEDLEIEECPSLTCLPGGNMLTRLQRLKIRGCTNLQSLLEGIMQKNTNTHMWDLKSLEIDNCPSLMCFPEGILPFSLKMLKICDCSKLEPLPEQLLHNNASLEYLHMRNNTTLRSLSPTLKTLEIYSCANLKSLPERVQNLASLQYLTVCDCPCLVLFPKGASLKELIIVGALDTPSQMKSVCLLQLSLLWSFLDSNGLGRSACKTWKTLYQKLSTSTTTLKEEKSILAVDSPQSLYRNRWGQEAEGAPPSSKPVEEVRELEPNAMTKASHPMRDLVESPPLKEKLRAYSGSKALVLMDKLGGRTTQQPIIAPKQSPNRVRIQCWKAGRKTREGFFLVFNNMLDCSTVVFGFPPPIWVRVCFSSQLSLREVSDVKGICFRVGEQGDTTYKKGKLWRFSAVAGVEFVVLWKILFFSYAILKGWDAVMVCQAACRTRFRALKHENGIARSANIVVQVIACFQPLQDCQVCYIPFYTL